MIHRKITGIVSDLSTEVQFYTNCGGLGRIPNVKAGEGKSKQENIINRPRQGQVSISWGGCTEIVGYLYPVPAVLQALTLEAGKQKKTH